MADKKKEAPKELAVFLKEPTILQKFEDVLGSGAASPYVQSVLIAVAIIALGAFAAASPVVAAQRKNPNQAKPATNLPNLPNPFRGTVENVTPNNLVAVGEKGPTGTFVIQAGTRILRDGKPIMAGQIFKGDPVQVSFSVVKTTGLMLANEIIVGNLPAPSPDAPAGTSSGGKKKKKNQ